MYKGKKVFVVTPSYNEAKHIDKVINGLPDYIDKIVIVDDCSTDNTAEIIEAQKSSKIIYVKNTKNLGCGASVTKAINIAIEKGAQITVTMAGDNQMDPKYLPSLLDPICDEQFDYTKGNRFYSKEGLEGMPKHRIFGSIILSFMTKIASGYWKIFDSQNGYYAIGPKALETINFNDLTTGFPLENDLLINLNINNLRVTDVSIPAVYGDEVSHMKIWKIIPSFTIFLVKGFFKRITYKYLLRGIHPIFLFLFFGSLLFVWGFFFGIFTWINSVKNIMPATTGTVMLAVLPLLMGFELLLWALVLDIQEEPK
jgi:glycosyltransferase involved in cell wall biosynthesis